MAVDLEPVPDVPALMADDILVVADLHIGLEEELREKGVRIPSRAETMGRRLLEVAERRGASRLTILGTSSTSSRRWPPASDATCTSSFATSLRGSERSRSHR